jgi:hypothetical protein
MPPLAITLCSCAYPSSAFNGFFDGTTLFAISGWQWRHVSAQNRHAIMTSTFIWKYDAIRTSIYKFLLARNEICILHIFLISQGSIVPDCSYFECSRHRLTSCIRWNLNCRVGRLLKIWTILLLKSSTIGYKACSLPRYKLWPFAFVTGHKLPDRFWPNSSMTRQISVYGGFFHYPCILARF